MILPGRFASGHLGPHTPRRPPGAPCSLDRKALPQPAPLWPRAAAPARPQRTSRRAPAQMNPPLPAFLSLLLLTLLCVSAMVQPAWAAGRPWIIENPQDVQFNMRPCQPVSVADLQRQMGAAWGSSRMAADEDQAKKLMNSSLEDEEDEEEEDDRSNDDDDDGLTGYQGDDPNAAAFMEEQLDVMVEDSGVVLDTSNDGGGVEGLEVDEKVVREEWMSSRSGLTAEEDMVETIDDRFKHPFLKDIHQQEDLLAGSRMESIRPRRRQYMRRRRRATSDKRSSQPRKRRFRGRTAKQRERINSDLTMRLFLQGKHKKMRKQLKRKFRENAKSEKERPAMAVYNEEEKFIHEGHIIFSRVLMGGEFTARKCFYRLFNCEPSYYTITLLQRDPDYCNPVPAVGNATVYEERWNLVKYQVVVGCNCASFGADKRIGRALTPSRSLRVLFCFLSVRYHEPLSRETEKAN